MVVPIRASRVRCINLAPPFAILRADRRSSMKVLTLMPSLVLRVEKYSKLYALTRLRSCASGMETVSPMLARRCEAGKPADTHSIGSALFWSSTLAKVN